MSSLDPQLCVADEATFWAWHRWPDFASWPDKLSTVIVVPVAGMADWGLGAPLDAEETVLMELLKRAVQRRAPGQRILVLPPLRFVVGPEPGCAFAVAPDVACQFFEEVLGSVAAAGFHKVLLLNASPWNEELCKAVGRDMRIARGLQMFSIHLSALGLDFHPVRGGERAAVRSVLACLAGTGADGEHLLESTATRLASLLLEITQRPPLPNGGALRQMTYP